MKIIDDFLWILSLSEAEMLAFLKQTLPSAIAADNGAYVYGKGELPVCLVAHFDRAPASPFLAFTDQPKVVYNDEEGLGFIIEGRGCDDRAGVLGILNILKLGYKPHTLFLNGEESGGWGARQAAQELLSVGKEIRFVIELDRCGWSDAAFYGCQNRKFIDYVLSFGYIPARGTFTDIVALCPAWDVAGVNLSIGFYDEHSSYECVVLEQWVDAIEGVVEILENLPQTRFSFGGGRRGRRALKCYHRNRHLTANDGRQ